MDDKQLIKKFDFINNWETLGIFLYMIVLLISLLLGITLGVDSGIVTNPNPLWWIFIAIWIGTPASIIILSFLVNSINEKIKDLKQKQATKTIKN